jgi:hypothetical protein
MTLKRLDEKEAQRRYLVITLPRVSLRSLSK